MPTQKIDVPDECPACGAWTCVEVGGPIIRVHCVTGHDGGCAWSMDMALDTTASGWIITGGKHRAVEAAERDARIAREISAIERHSAAEARGEVPPPKLYRRRNTMMTDRGEEG
jgi:hypothetical protein